MKRIVAIWGLLSLTAGLVSCAGYTVIEPGNTGISLEKKTEAAEAPAIDKANNDDMAKTEKKK